MVCVFNYTTCKEHGAQQKSVGVCVAMKNKEMSIQEAMVELDLVSCPVFPSPSPHHFPLTPLKMVNLVTVEDT